MRRLRPHHGMCLAFFVGKGYSGRFTAHLAELKRSLHAHSTVRLVEGTDEICTHCPNNLRGVCRTAEKVREYDRRVLALCGLEPGAELPWEALEQRISQRIIKPGLRRSVCKDCQWGSLCAAQEAGVAARTSGKS